jgi:glycogen phosphorylase
MHPVVGVIKDTRNMRLDSVDALLCGQLSVIVLHCIRLAKGWRTVENVTVDDVRIQDDRTGLSVETLTRAILDNLFYLQAKNFRLATKHDWYMALAYTVRDRIIHRWIATMETCFRRDTKVVCYLSAEFLTGPHLHNNLVNLDIYNKVELAVEQSGSGYHLADLIDVEEEPGLGNGGLGRLAACYVDSMATNDIPAFGYGIRYEYGIFDQAIRDGFQVEATDSWLHYGNPWEIRRSEVIMPVRLGGYTQVYFDEKARYRVEWLGGDIVNGVAYDTAIPGYKTNTCSTLRLWKAESVHAFDFLSFNAGDYAGAVQNKIVSENISKVLYPNDQPAQGRRLRLQQQYFFVSCSLQDIIRVRLKAGDKIEQLDQKVAIQLNDTHPAVSVAEMMRLLVDVHALEWDVAWKMTQNIFAYTNHTLLPEALERWPVSLFGNLLPRHLEIIYEINRRFMEMVKEKYPNDPGKWSRLSLIDEAGERYVRMANLACVGSHAINGVAELHSELLKSDVLRDFYELWPEKFSNVTNGVTPRRFVLASNPGMSSLISSKIGDRWIHHLNELRQIEPLAEDASFRKAWREAKLENKQRLAYFILDKTGVAVDPNSLFDIQVKRIHEYKRQHLNVLHIMTLYNRLKKNPNLDITPRTFIFGGKAAPGYFMAKLIIKLINSVADVVNNDPDVGGKLKVVFIPDFNVKVGQKIYPAADLSEQISTAGLEASGTGNMKFSLNGALTVGTLDGANVEIREEVGAENFFLFGLTADQVAETKARGYRPYDIYTHTGELKECLDQLANGYWSHGDRNLFMPIVDNLRYSDHFLVLADYQAYIDCQTRIGEAYKDQETWSRMSILNVARMGKFSSDRSIEDYCKNIWHVDPVDVIVEVW